MKTRVPINVPRLFFLMLLLGSVASAEVKYYGQFTEASPTDIQPQGWVKEMLHRQVEGLGKNHAVSGYPYNTCLWAGKIPPDLNPQSKAWWPYEQAGYLVDGLERLGLASGDPTIVGEARDNIRFILLHEQADGSLGPDDIGPTNWPHAVVFRSLMAAYSAKPDPSIPAEMQRHYLARPADFGVGRDVCNVEEMLWAYAHTDDDKLLAIAKRTYDNFNATKPAFGFGRAGRRSQDRRARRNLQRDRENPRAALSVHRRSHAARRHSQRLQEDRSRPHAGQRPAHRGGKTRRPKSVGLHRNLRRLRLHLERRLSADGHRRRHLGRPYREGDLQRGARLHHQGFQGAPVFLRAEPGDRHRRNLQTLQPESTELSAAA